MNLREISRLLYQIKLTNQEINTLFEKETGFSLTRYEMLKFLKDKGTCSQNQIQTELKIDSAAITRHLKILEQRAMSSGNGMLRITERSLFNYPTRQSKIWRRAEKNMISGNFPYHCH